MRPYLIGIALVISQRSMQRMVRRFWGGLFTLVIALAVLVQLGREAFPLLNDYRDDISQILGKRLGVDISIGEVAASWSGLRPEIELRSVVVSSLQDNTIFKVRRVNAQLSLLDSLFKGTLRWRRLAFYELETTLVQSEQGPWQLKYLKSRASKRPDLRARDPLDVFLFGRRIEIENASFNLEFRTGHESVLSVPKITLENDRDFHRVTASAAVVDEAGEEQQHFIFTVEGTGDPRDADNFDSVGYLALKKFPMEKVVAAFAGSHWQNQAGNRWNEGHRLDMELWYRGSTKKGVTVRGHLRSDGLPLNVPEHFTLPNQLSSDITGKWHPKDGWTLSLQQLALHWPEFKSPVVNAQLSGGLGQSPKLAIDHVDLNAWHVLTERVGVLQGKAAEALDTLKPEGVLSNVEIAFGDASSGYFRLAANLEDVGVMSYKGAPEIRQLDGYLSASAFDGYVDILNQENFKIHFPKVYEEPMAFDKATGRVAWTVDREQHSAYVSSSKLTLVEGNEAAHGYLHLDIPTQQDGREAYMTLVIGMANGPVSLHHKYVPVVIPSNLKDWLGRSIGNGSASDLAFIYHGSISKNAKIPPAIQLHANVHNGNLAFDPQWPALTDVHGRLRLDNRHLDVQVKKASLLGNRVKNAEVLLIDNPEGEGLALSIQGQLNSNAGAAMNLLQNSPVRSVFGATFDSWQFDGDVSAAIALQIPLTSNAQGMRQSVNVSFSGAEVDMRDLNLRIDKVKGRLLYDSHKGLVAKKMTGQIWGRPVTASIDSPIVSSTKKPVRETRIQFSGEFDVASIRDWTLRPELGFVDGGAHVNGVITIPARGLHEHFLEVELSSALQGVGFELPEPMGKTLKEEKDFLLNLRLFEGYQHYQFEYDNLVTLRMRTGEKIENSAQVSIGEASIDLQPGFFDVLGRVDHFDLEVWDEVKERYFAYIDAGEELNPQEDQDALLPIRLNLDIGTASLGDAVIEGVHVNGLGTENQWELRVASELTAGDITVRNTDGQTQLQMDLDFLRFVSEHGRNDDNDLQLGDEDSDTIKDSNNAAAGNPDAWLMADIDLSKLTFPVQFSVQELSFDGAPYGRWAFDLMPIERGIVLSKIQANIRGLAIGEPMPEIVVEEAVEAPRKKQKYGKFGQSKGKVADKSARERYTLEALAKPHAEFVWTQHDTGNQSTFRGTLMANDVGAQLEAWGLEKLLESRQGIVTAEVSWPGAPDEISLQKVAGKVVFDMEDGSFIRGANEGDNGLLRLIALFNFDTIARRLKLDFTDLAKEGFGFESVHGEFDFQNGWVYINEPLVVDSTSSKIQMAGTLDLIEEKIDAELVATLPVAGDITVAAALIAGLPAAVGVFLVSQMFEEQVDKASSINYSVRGDWEDPKIKFRKIFDDSAASAKGREVESMSRQNSRSVDPAPLDSPPGVPLEPTPETEPELVPLPY